MSSNKLKQIRWVGTSKKDLGGMPIIVQDTFGYALYLAQIGEKSDCAKVLSGFGSAGVLEVIDDWQGDTYRAVYTVKFTQYIYVLHCFKKKSTKGIATPKMDLALINDRLQAVKLFELRGTYD